MSKFDPLKFDYFIHSEDNQVSAYRKNLYSEDITFIQALELIYWKKVDIYIISIKIQDMKHFLPDIEFSDIPEHITLFIGELKSDFDYRLIMTKILKDPAIIAKLAL